jgi:hypothetical protein
MERSSEAAEQLLPPIIRLTVLLNKPVTTMDGRTWYSLDVESISDG